MAPSSKPVCTLCKEYEPNHLVIEETVICCVCAALLDYLMNQEPDNDFEAELMAEVNQQEKLKN